MKVLFLFQGTTHYYNKVLAKLHGHHEIEITDVVPKQPHALGAGVYQTKKGITFPIIVLDERRLWGKHFCFMGLGSVLKREKPDIIVVTRSHLVSLVLDPIVYLQIRIQHIKVVLKDHPFRIPTQQERIQEISRYTTTRKVLGVFKPVMTIAARIWGYMGIWLEKWLYTFPEAYVCYIDDAYRVFTSWGVPKNKIFIMGNSPDTDEIFRIKATLQPSLENNPHRIIHTGRLVAWKKVDLLIQAVAKLKPDFPQIELLVIGFGPEETALKKLAQKLKLESQVKFLGGIYDPEQLGGYLLSSAVYVLAGMGGISINEAMCYGLPIICSVGDGTEKLLVTNGENGLYFKEGDEEDLVKKITYLFNHPELRIQMGSKSVETIHNKMNIQTVLAGYERVFKYAMRQT